ncbi:hypothetical protein EYF80_052456 [Liparis tanakae]|uniref:Uncharacterized protein n=1 Tax=Liparis tanakae TaxID=230148 RepID=A0A4Z2F8C1_9TELE|nr:hypothetical protein EYF80_052456 [Liparis tanakae]
MTLRWTLKCRVGPTGRFWEEMHSEPESHRPDCVFPNLFIYRSRLRARPGRHQHIPSGLWLHTTSRPSGRTPAASPLTGRGNVSIDLSPREAIRPRCPTAFRSNRGLSRRISAPGGERCLSDTSFPSGESMKGPQVRGEATRGVMASSDGSDEVIVAPP